MTLLILSALLPSATASSTSSLLRGNIKSISSIYRGLPQHGAQRPSIPFQSEENLRKLILIASSSSSRNHSDSEREEARRRLVNMLKPSDEDAAYSGKQQRELAINRDNLTKEQRQRIKKMNAQRKKKNADRKKKKEEEKQPHTSGLLQAKPSSKNDDKKPSSKNDDKNENMKPNTSGSLQAKPSKNDDKNENMQPNTSGLLQAKPSSKNDDNNDNGTQTDGKFSFTIPPSDEPKPQAASGSFSAYEPGKSMADEFVSALAQAFVA